MASVGKHIKHLRTARNMTQEQLAERLFVTRQAVSAWETEKALPDVDTLEGIASALDAEVTEVIYGVSQARDLKRIKRRWALIGGIIVIILAIIYIILNNYGFIHLVVQPAVFGFYVFPPESYRGDLLPEGWENAGTVAITVTGLPGSLPSVSLISPPFPDEHMIFPHFSSKNR